MDTLGVLHAITLSTKRLDLPSPIDSSLPVPKNVSNGPSNGSDHLPAGALL